MANGSDNAERLLGAVPLPRRCYGLLVTRFAWLLAAGIAGTVNQSCGRLGFAPISNDAEPLSDDAADAMAANYNEFGSVTNWSTFDTKSVNPGASGFVGAAFDGRYVYFVPSYNGTLNGIVTRYDTQADFSVAAAWTTFDTTTVNANARGYNGGVFDGRYLYLVPQENLQGADGVVARYDTQAAFGDSAAWSTFDMATVSAGAVGYYGATFDGRYIYFSPYVGVRAARYDTTLPFNQARAWSLFNLTQLLTDVPAYPGAVFDGRYAYYVPLYNGAGGSGRVSRVDTTADFTAAPSWSSFDTATLTGAPKGFVGGAFDGRYLYLVPFVSGQGMQHGVVTRFDTRAAFGNAASWSTFDTNGVSPTAKAFIGGAFDGRFAYFVPATNGQVTRYDSAQPFEATAAWATFDTTTVAADARGFNGAVFDGRYLYLVPHSGSRVARFDAKTPRALPPLPFHFGSFL